MTFLPIVERELRAAARRKSTYRIRSWTALLAIVIGFFSLMFLWLARGRGSLGNPLFTYLTGYAFGLSLLAGVFLTADCLSEEKREGTLGLLFLTDLHGYDVVLGKLAASSLNGIYGMMAVMPMLAIPLLMGGVSPGEFGRMALVAINTLFFSLSVGICLSAMSHSARKSMTATLVLLLLGLLLPPRRRDVARQATA